MIKVNGEVWTPGGDSSIAAILAEKGVATNGAVSVQLNGEFLDESLYAATKVKDGDEVDYLYFLGGGEE